MQFVVATDDAHDLARGYINRVRIAEGALRSVPLRPRSARLHPGLVPRTLRKGRPARIDQLEQLLASGWQRGPRCGARRAGVQHSKRCGDRGHRQPSAQQWVALWSATAAACKDVAFKPLTAFVETAAMIPG